MPKWIPFVLFAACLCGCVERRVYLISEPPGADVYIDGELIGRTRPGDHPDGPLAQNFVFYGSREFTFRKPGFETVNVQQRLETPWYEYPPLDFICEVLLPFPLVDEHFVEVKLEAARPADVEALVAGARDFRRASRPEERFEYRAVATIQEFEIIKAGRRKR